MIQSLSLLSSSEKTSWIDNLIDFMTYLTFLTYLQTTFKPPQDLNSMIEDFIHQSIKHRLEHHLINS